MAAVLACGPGAVLAHRSAAVLWGLCPDQQSRIDVTAPNRRGRALEGIAAHRSGALLPQDHTLVRGIPCTSIPQTLLDMASAVSIRELANAVSEAEVLRLLDRAAVREVLERNRGRRGTGRLRSLLADLDPQTRRTRSTMERRFLAICRRNMLPIPEVNTSVRVADTRVEPDFLWRDVRLIVETDGRQCHDTASAFERDRRRDQQLQMAGWRVVRCTWRQVVDEPVELSRTLRALLAC